MPLYSYQCQDCDTEFELFFPLQEWDVIPNCPDCNGVGRKIYTCQIQRDEPVWLDDSVRDAIQDRDSPHKEIATRTDYKRYLKDNGITERA